MSGGAWIAVALLALGAVVVTVAVVTSIADRFGVFLGSLTAAPDPVGDPHE